MAALPERAEVGLTPAEVAACSPAL
jgi:hypothetical protein